jgi:hypothetical protein
MEETMSSIFSKNYPDGHKFNIQVLTIIAVLIIVESHLFGLANPTYIDMSFHRAVAYQYFFPNDDLFIKIQNYLQDYISQNKYFADTEIRYLSNNKGIYIFSSLIVLIFECFPMKSAYQSVYLANVCVSLISIFCLFWASNKTLNSKGVPFFAIFLLSASPCILFYPYYLPLFTPFAILQFMWNVWAPRGAAIVFFVAFLLFFASQNLSKSKKYFFTIVFFVLSLLTHLTINILLTTIIVSLAIGYKIFKIDFNGMKSRFWFKKIFLVFNIGILLVIGIQMLIYYYLLDIKDFIIVRTVLGTSPWQMYIAKTLKMFSWLISSNILIYLWLKLYSKSKFSTSQFIILGNFFFKLFFPFAILTIGLQIVYPRFAGVIFLSPVFIFEQTCLRITGFTQLLFWLILGIFLYEKYYEKYSKVFCIATYTVLILLCLSMGVNFYLLNKNTNIIAAVFRKDCLTVHFTERLSLPVQEIYGDRELYFNSIANELRDKHLRNRFIYKSEGR